MANIQGTCASCMDNCSASTYGPCLDTCPPDDFQCKKVCLTRLNNCQLVECLKGGQCCEESCYVPPLTLCQLCDEANQEAYNACTDGCDPDTEFFIPCVQECQYVQSERAIDCYENRQCCDETCGENRASLLRQLRMKSMRGNSLLQQQHATYRRPARMNPNYGMPIRNAAQAKWSPYDIRKERMY